MLATTLASQLPSLRMRRSVGAQYHPKRGLRPDIAAAIVTIERRLRMPASAEVALTVMEYED